MENMVGDEEIQSLIHSIWPSCSWTCCTVHYFGGTALFSSEYEAVFSWFLRSMDSVMPGKIVDKQNPMRVQKYGCHNLASPLLSFRSLWTTFTSCCPLSLRSFSLRCEVVDSCFIHCHIPTKKILFTSLEQLQTALWNLDALLFLVGCEQTRHSLRKQLTHPQGFVQNCKYTIFWYL